MTYDRDARLANGDVMIRLRMSTSDLERMHFAYSPLTEVAESLYMLHSGRIHPLHRNWFEMTRGALRRADTNLLRAVIPARSYIANFLLGGSTGVSTSIEKQLRLLADCPPQRLRADLEEVWSCGKMPLAARQLIQAGGGHRLADALWQYWQAAIEPYWGQIRAVLDADIAYRAGRLTTGGIQALMSDLHPRLQLTDHCIPISRRPGSEYDLVGSGLLLIPCAFAWPHLIAHFGTSGAPSLTYGARGVGRLWEAAGQKPSEDDDALGALLGRTRAAVLTGIALPKSTTDLARELSQSPATVSAHLSILRRCGLVTSWRSGRRVLYQRTPLADSIVSAAIQAGSAASVDSA